MTIKKILQHIIPALVVLLIAGCGYYNPYIDHGYKHISLYRSMWPNRTTEIGLENTIFQAQSDWFRKSPLITMTDSPEEADYELSGSIDRIYYPEISFGKYREGIQGRSELLINFAVKDRKTGKIVWERKDYTLLGAFPMTQDLIQLQAYKRAALAASAQALGEEIYLYVVDQLLRPNPTPFKEKPKPIIPLGDQFP